MKYGINEVIARLIINRGVSEDKIKEYIDVPLESMHNPSLMKDMDKLVSILKDKITQNKRILVVGDYDVDGIVSTYILVNALGKCGALVEYEVPDRIKDGYGINVSIIDEAYKNGFDTILTCDNGISAIEQVKHAKELGMTMLITDHHDILKDENTGDEIIPLADAVVNPHQSQCGYPFKYLCGAGVAYKVIEALTPSYGFTLEDIRSYIQFVAIATVCDVVDLVDENRIIVKNGLRHLKETNNIGLRCLFDINGLKDISSYHLGFVVGPCLNASGRLDTAKKAIKLLSTSNYEEAGVLAEELKSLNDERKSLTVKGLEEAIEIIEASSLKDDKVLVVYLPWCHESLAGIIAGRIKEKYYKPTIVLTDAENCVKGSCRSIEAYNIFEELQKCSDILLKFGGHPMAAGLSLEKENVDNLRKRLNTYTTLTDEDIIPKVSIDIALPLGYLNESLINELKIIEPCGKANEKPIFAEKDVMVNRIRKLGKNQNVLKINITNQYNKTLDAMYFGDVDDFEDYIINKYGSDELDKAYRGMINDIKLALIYYPDINEYNGIKTLQINIKEYQ
ncbi:MAG: single-stranded-DNA-specific exonuclease RecJ [Lachnospiraceae bacterium]|nr:single-stranded-DNA-specific exonuclease RecJ [Lachnospiraceae bacterium]